MPTARRTKRRTSRRSRRRQRAGGPLKYTGNALDLVTAIKRAIHDGDLSRAKLPLEMVEEDMREDSGRMVATLLRLTDTELRQLMAWAHTALPSAMWEEMARAELEERAERRALPPRRPESADALRAKAEQVLKEATTGANAGYRVAQITIGGDLPTILSQLSLADVHRLFTTLARMNPDAVLPLVMAAHRAELSLVFQRIASDVWYAVKGNYLPQLTVPAGFLEEGAPAVPQDGTDGSGSAARSKGTGQRLRELYEGRHGLMQGLQQRFSKFTQAAEQRHPQEYGAAKQRLGNFAQAAQQRIGNLAQTAQQRYPQAYDAAKQRLDQMKSNPPSFLQRIRTSLDKYGTPKSGGARRSRRKASRKTKARRVSKR